MQEYLDKAEQEMKLRNFSPKTIKSYLGVLRRYFASKGEDIGNIDVAHMKKYLVQMLEGGKSARTVNVVHQAICYFYREVMKQNALNDLHYAKTDLYLPVVLSKPEVIRLLSVTENQKHRLLLSVAYGAGLRVSEVVDLQCRDVDCEELVIHIKKAKGYKDRMTVVPKSIQGELRKIMCGNNCWI